jgi:predicted acyl esterase
VSPIKSTNRIGGLKEGYVANRSCSAEDALARRTSEETIRDGYERIKDVYIPLRDGSELCANVYLPTRERPEKFSPWAPMARMSFSGTLEDRTHVCIQTWHRPLRPSDRTLTSNTQIRLSGYVPSSSLSATLNNENQVKEHGYAHVRCDVRGSGASPGVLDAFGLGRTALIGEDSEGQVMSAPILTLLRPT